MCVCCGSSSRANKLLINQAAVQANAGIKRQGNKLPVLGSVLAADPVFHVSILGFRYKHHSFLYISYLAAAYLTGTVVYQDAFQRRAHLNTRLLLYMGENVSTCSAQSAPEPGASVNTDVRMLFQKKKKKHTRNAENWPEMAS